LLAELQLEKRMNQLTYIRNVADNLLPINGARLWENLMEMAAIGATKKGGNSRLALTKEDSAGRRKFINDCLHLGMTVTTDAIGNLFCRYQGSDPKLDPVVMGSHLDTQPKGGRFDGIYGVLAALEGIRTLSDMGIIPVRSIEIAVWTNEEGTLHACDDGICSVYWSHDA
jgi:N-carbamoyl-L-amino-acid hydrolase